MPPPRKRRRPGIWLALAALSLVVLAAVSLLRGRQVRGPVPEPDLVLAAAREDAIQIASADDTHETESGAEKTPASALFEARLRLPEPTAARRLDYDSRRPKTVLDLQQFREATQIPIDDGVEGSGSAALVQVNPLVNVWTLLVLEWDDDRETAVYHLENPAPRRAEIRLDPDFPRGVVVRTAVGDRRCDLWTPSSALTLEDARARGRAYVRLCDDTVLLRTPVEGRKTRLESATDFLRDRVWEGEALTVFVRKNLYQDDHLVTSDLIAPATSVDGEAEFLEGAPPAPRLDPRFDGFRLKPAELGLELEPEEPDGVEAGRWYAVREQEGVYVSTVQARLVAPEIVESQKGRVNPLDDIEASALVYMVAFDPRRLETRFALGTDHPRVIWSDRVPPSVRDDNLEGPDGIGNVAPLVRTGQVGPIAARRLVATFTGGFKRSHGAFKRTGLATTNFGSHYGFVEGGAVLSKLQPDLATVVVWNDGTVQLKTWTEADSERLAEVRFARQNGVPLVEPDENGVPRPGALVPRWADGNWSGSQEQRLRTLRAGLCQLPAEDGGFLIYGYFSGATPSGMARVFQAYGCQYALLLDMNALEHTYLATYSRRGEELVTSHLIEEMEVLDETGDGRLLPRFVAFADNRDFFYLLRKETPP